MNYRIQNNTTIADVQQAFRRHFPFLKIEFLPKPHQWGEYNSDRVYFSTASILCAIAENANGSMINLMPWQRTGDVEEMFAGLGLNVQVFRKNAEDWIQTAGTDDLTLDEQNEIGKRTLMKSSYSLWVEKEKMF